jgi:fatty acid desaturase
MTFALLLHATALFLLPAAGAALIVSAPLHPALRFLLVAPLTLLAGQGLHQLAFAGHEGFHLNLHRDKYTSALLGILFSSLAASYLVVGYFLTHWEHHRYTNQPQDPDCQFYAPLHGFWRRLLLSRARSTQRYRQHTFLLALGRPPVTGATGPFSLRELKWLARLNLLTSFGVTGAYVAIILLAPLPGLVAIVVPHLVAYGLSGLRTYVEHADTGVGPFRNARSYTSPLFTALCFGNNYHLEHHLYPNVPCYHLPRAHRYLRDQGAYASGNALVEPRLSGVLPFLTSRATYPSGHPVPPQS